MLLASQVQALIFVARIASAGSPPLVNSLLHVFMLVYGCLLFIPFSANLEGMSCFWPPKSRHSFFRSDCQCTLSPFGKLAAARCSFQNVPKTFVFGVTPFLQTTRTFSCKKRSLHRSMQSSFLSFRTLLFEGSPILLSKGFLSFRILFVRDP